MKRLIPILGFLLVGYQGFPQTTHPVTVAIGQGDGCPVVDAVETSALFSVFPNPATASVTVKSQIQTADLRLIDFQGKKVMMGKITDGSFTLNVKDLTRGNYVLLLEHENGTEKMKIKVQ